MSNSDTKTISTNIFQSLLIIFLSKFLKRIIKLLLVAVREDVLPLGSLVAHWSKVRGPSLACENQNKPLPRPNDAIMKVVRLSADEDLPPSFKACSASYRASAPNRASRVHSLAARVDGGCQVQIGKDSKGGSVAEKATRRSLDFYLNALD